MTTNFFLHLQPSPIKDIAIPGGNSVFSVPRVLKLYKSKPWVRPGARAVLDSDLAILVEQFLNVLATAVYGQVAQEDPAG